MREPIDSVNHALNAMAHPDTNIGPHLELWRQLLSIMIKLSLTARIVFVSDTNSWNVISFINDFIS
jgi:hypothetical protein